MYRLLHPMSLSPADLIALLNAVPPELLLLFQALFCFGTILVMVRLFGAPGLYLYIATAVIAANVEVLKAVQFGFYDHPVAMGTVGAFPDVISWKNEVAAALPDGDASIVVNLAGDTTITIQWDDNRDGTDPIQFVTQTAL